MSEADEGQRFKDLWAWADEGDEEAHLPAVSPDDVVAVMVVRDAEAWLEPQLAALGRLDPRPARIVAVDVGSEDESPALLGEAEQRGIVDAIVTLDRATRFAEAVEAGVDADSQWLWILHDDSAPDPDALGQLLEVAVGADVLVPKLLAPRRRNYPDIISEVGQSISRGGFRVGAEEEGEIDQHQVEPGAVLGGSTAGLLVRMEAWRELDGLAPEVPRGRDGVDLGWRANVAGLRVVTCPSAALVHREAGHTQDRVADEHPHVADRLGALRVVGARGTGTARLWLGTVGRTLGFLFLKSPGHAGAEVKAFRRYRSSRSETAALAARIPEGDTEYVDELLAPPHWAIRHGFDRLGNAVMERYRDFTDPETSIDDLTSDEFTGFFGSSRRLLSPVALMSVGFLVLGVAAGWRLLGAAQLAGGGLLAAPTSVSGAWDAYLSSGTPWLGIVALLASITFGFPQVLSWLLLLLGPFLAALSTHSLARSVGMRPGLAAVAGALWASSVLVLGLPSAGDVSGIVVAITAPRLVAALIRVVRDDARGAESLRAPAAVAFWLFVVGAFWPLALPLVTIAAAVLVGRRRRDLARWLVAILPAWLLFVPWLGELVRHPGRVLTGVDPLAWPDYPPSGYGLLLGRVVPSGLPVWLSIAFFVPLALLATWGLLRIPRASRRWLVTAWIVVPLLAGAGLSRAALDVDGGQARALLTVWALAVASGMIAAVVLAERPRDPRPRRLVSVILAGILAAGAAIAWPVLGFKGPVESSGSVLPGYVHDVVESPRASRVLLIRDVDDALAWNVVDAERPRWGSAEHYPPGEFQGEFEELVQAFAGAAVPEDLAERLAGLSISHVFLDGFAQEDLAALENASGLTSAPASESAVSYTVVGLVSRVNVVDADGTVTPVVEDEVPAGGADRELTVATQAPDLRVSVGGQELARSEGEIATYALGDASGTLEIETPRMWWALTWSIVLVLALALLAAPSLQQRPGARRGDEEAEL